jgi:hypothetical protein
MDDTLDELGLTQPTTDDPYCGRYHFDDGSWADVTGVLGPFPCWDIVVFTADGGRLTKIETGDGDLADYWPTVVLIADGMLKAFLLQDNQPTT